MIPIDTAVSRGWREGRIGERVTWPEKLPGFATARRLSTCAPIQLLNCCCGCETNGGIIVLLFLASELSNEGSGYARIYGVQCTSPAVFCRNGERRNNTFRRWSRWSLKGEEKRGANRSTDPWTMDLGMHWRQSSFNFRKLIYLPANYQVINCKEIVSFGGEIIPWKTFFLTFLIPSRSNRKNYQLTVINPGIETSSLSPFVVTGEELLFAN